MAFGFQGSLQERGMSKGFYVAKPLWSTISSVEGWREWDIRRTMYTEYVEN